MPSGTQHGLFTEDKSITERTSCYSSILLMQLSLHAIHHQIHFSHYSSINQQTCPYDLVVNESITVIVNKTCSIFIPPYTYNISWFFWSSLKYCIKFQFHTWYQFEGIHVLFAINLKKTKSLVKLNRLFSLWVFRRESTSVLPQRLLGNMCIIMSQYKKHFGNIVAYICYWDLKEYAKN